MGLWLERRDEKGNLVFRGKFHGGQVVGHLDNAMSIEDVMRLVKPSAHLPLAQREWTLRVGSDD